MDEKPIQNCEVRFRFRCPKQWDSLRETAEPGVRSCSQCQKQVYLCQSMQEVVQHAREGHCVAVPRWVAAPADSPDDFERVQALARQHGMLAIRLRDLTLDSALLQIVPREVARKHHLIAVDRAGSTLVVAMSDPTDIHAIDEVRFITGYNVEAVGASRRDIEEAIARADREDPRHVELGVIAEEVPEPPSMEGPIGRLIQAILLTASREKVGQVQIEATDSSLVIRYDVAGTPRDVMRPPVRLGHELLRQLRLASGAGPGEEGRLEFRAEGQCLHYLVRIHSTASGDEVVLQPLPARG